MNIKKVIEAINYAAKKHQNQRRKNKEKTPYINHPIEVANTLADVGNVVDENTIIAAFLHDTIEDTYATPEEIDKLFGKEVLSIVLELTDDKRLPKKERKRLQVENAPKKTKSAKLVKLADKICNIKSIYNEPPVNWSLEKKLEYLNWAKKVVHGLRGINQALEKVFDKLYQKNIDKLSS